MLNEYECVILTNFILSPKPEVWDLSFNNLNSAYIFKIAMLWQ